MNGPHNAQHPYGPRMCELICDLTACRSPLFHKQDLICFLTASKSYESVRILTLKTASSCLEGSSVLITKRNGRKCIKVENCEEAIRKNTSAAIQGVRKGIPRNGADTTVLPVVSPNAQQHLICNNSVITLHQACKQGNLDVVKCILTHRLTDINYRGSSGNSPVIVTAREGHFKVFDYLVSQGCDLSLRNHKNDSVLHMACYGGNTDIVRKCINDKSDLNSVGSFGRTPVMFAVYAGHKKAFELLVSKGCKVQILDMYHNNLLHLACVGGHADIVKYIVKHKLVAIDSRGARGATAVMQAAEHGHLEIVIFLKGHEADLKLLDDCKRNILHVACLHNHVPIVNYIFSLNIVHKESRDQSGKTPLLIAAYYGHKEVFDYLISRRCNSKAVDANNDNILHLACRNGKIAMVKHIINQRKVGIESKGYRGRTPLLTAASTPHVMVFYFLVKKGCNTKAVDDRNNNILHIACLVGYLEMVQYITRRYNVDIESKGYRGRTPLMLTARMGHIEVFRFLHKIGCNVRSVDSYDNTILHLACASGSVETVKYIVMEIRFDKDHRGHFGCAPVFYAIAHGHIEVVKFLRGEGCNMKTLDNYNNNVMHVACYGGHIDMVRYLNTLRIVSMNDRNNKGFTPLDTAKKGGHGEIVHFLEGI